MENLVILCKRRGFLFQSSEIYGGLNGFRDYGPPAKPQGGYSVPIISNRPGLYTVNVMKLFFS